MIASIINNVLYHTAICVEIRWIEDNCRQNCNLDADQVPYQIELYYYLYLLMWDGVSHLINKQIYVSPTVTYP